MNLQFDFVVDKASNRITIRREFAAERQLVWDCYSRSDLLDRWFSPKPLTTRTSHMAFEPGGYWHYAMVSPDGEEYWGRLDYQEIDPIDRFTALDGFTDETGALNPDLPRSSWDVTFQDVDKGCLVTTIVGYASADDLQKVIDMGVQAGMTSTLEHLDELLEVLKAPSHGG